MALTRGNIIDSVRHKLKLTKSESVQIVESLLEIIKKTWLKDRRVTSQMLSIQLRQFFILRQT